MENNDSIKELFKEKLGDFEANVRPEIWSSISSQLVSSPAGVGAFATSILTKGAVALSIVAAVSAVVYFSSNQTEPSDKSLKETNSKALTTTETVKEQTQKVESTTIKPNGALQTEQDSTKEGEENKQTNESILDVETTNNSNHPLENVHTVIASEKPLENTLMVTDKPEINTLIKPVITEVFSNLNEAHKQTYTLDLPNIFTPNNDGINDFLIVNTTELTEFSLVVLDQRNRIIYTSQDTNLSWDGLGISGEPVPSGNYVYFITARDAAGSLVTKHSLLRIER